jgi:hypothetical protein
MRQDMTVAWAAIAVAAATVVANVVGVWWAGRTQRKLARAERIGAREIETYVDLLRWVKEIQTKTIEDLDLHAWHDLARALDLPTDLDVRVTAFASRNVRKSVREAHFAWVELNHKLSSNDDPLAWAARKLTETHDVKDFFTVIPEFRTAMEAAWRIEDAVREVTAPDARQRRRGLSSKFRPPPSASGQ